MPETPTTAQIMYLRSLIAQRATYGDTVGYEESKARLDAFLATGPSFADVSSAIDKAKRSPRYSPSVMPITGRQRTELVKLATTKAIYGFALTPEETEAKVLDFLDDHTHTAADANVLTAQARNAQPHPTSQTGLSLDLIEGIEGVQVHEGHYAVSHDDTLRFYRIYTPTSGRLQGQAVMRRMASESMLALYPTEARTVLLAIARDPSAAAFRYADEFRACYRCGRPLTDAISRLLSLGPHCRGFANHSGLRAVANDVDHNTERRLVYRALRAWSIDHLRRTEPGTEHQSKATRIAAAWSGIPTVLHRDPDDAVALVSEALYGDLSNELAAALTDSPPDTLVALIESEVLSSGILTALLNHKSSKVRDAANEFFLAALSK